MRGTSKGHDEGATAVEYALMLALIFIVIVASVGLLGTNLAGFYDNAAALI